MTPRYARIEGVLVEPLGRLWAAYSPACGETALLNDESASVLEVLEQGEGTTASIAATLAADSGLPPLEVADIIGACWPRLIEGGLVRECRAGHSHPR